MKKILLFSGLLLAATTAQAQTHLLGVKGGFTSTSALEDLHVGELTERRKGVTAGITYEYITKGGFSLLADLLYSQRGYRNDYAIFTQTFSTSGPTYGEPIYVRAYNLLTTYSYLTLPLRMGFNTGNTFYGSVNAGLVPALLLHSQEPYFARASNGPVTAQGTADVTAQKKRFDIAIIAEIGGGYKFQNGSRVFATVSVQQSAYDVNKELGSGYGPIKHNGVAFMLGFKWAIPKRSAASTIPVVKE